MLLLALSITLISVSVALLSIVKTERIYNTLYTLNLVSPNFGYNVTVRFIHPYEWAYSILFLGVSLFSFEVLRILRLSRVFP